MAKHQFISPKVVRCFGRHTPCTGAEIFGERTQMSSDQSAGKAQDPHG